MATILQHQVETFARSVSELLAANRARTLARREVEAALVLWMSLSDAVDVLDASWRKAAAAATPHTAEHVRSVGEEIRQVSDLVRQTRAALLAVVGRAESEGHTFEGAARFRSKVPHAFDDRPLDLPITGPEVAAFVAAAAGSKSPDLPDDADDDL